MKHSFYAIIVFFSFLVVQESIAQERKFGLGVIIGESTGISAKLWTSNYTAFDFGLGRSNGGNLIHYHMDYLWHSFEAIHSTGRFPLYFGVGGRINSGTGYISSLAIRCILGIAWLPRDTPIDVFIELAPSFQLTSSTGFIINTSIGARFFF